MEDKKSIEEKRAELLDAIGKAKNIFDLLSQTDREKTLEDYIAAASMYAGLVESAESIVINSGRTYLLIALYIRNAELYRLSGAEMREPQILEEFLESVTPGKVRKALPSLSMSPQEEAALTYTREELRALRSGLEEEKAAARKARRDRAGRFLSSLNNEQLLTIAEAIAPKKLPSEDMPKGTASRVKGYVTTKDVLSKAVFGEPIKSGKIAELVRKTPGALPLWTTGAGKNKKTVVVYTRLEPDEEALKAAGITIGKSLSICAREVFGALLSHYFAGNTILSLGMVGKIIFNVRNSNDLTEAQAKYIYNGATEVFGTLLFVDTMQQKKTAAGEVDSRYTTLYETQKIKLKRLEQVFPGRITAAEINGNVAEVAIELFRLPILYRLQDELAKGHILRAPIEMMEIPGRTDEDIITLRGYLMRRIDAMKRGNLSRMIIYKNILDEVGIDPANRAQRNRRSSIQNKVDRILTYWAEIGIIHGYEKLTKAGKPVKGTAPIYEIEIRL